MMVPYTTLEPQGSDNPRDLWKWMRRTRRRPGRVLAIAHNGNLSNGIMFPRRRIVHRQEDRTSEYAETRARWEPLYEVTQIKGDGETHPLPVAERRVRRLRDLGQGQPRSLGAQDRRHAAVRVRALGAAIGLEIERRVGVNPYKFGMIGSTDSHTGLATAEEDNFFGKHSGAEPEPERWKHPMAKMGDVEIQEHGHGRSGAGRGLGAREHARGALRRDGAQGDLRHDRVAHAGALLRRLGVR